MKISVCWIAKNEEFNIARSIKSVMDFVDEMIVVDTGSTDKTAEVAASLGARVEHFEWINDFAAARNYAISFSTGDVVICPDADMWFDPPFSKRHRDRIAQELKFPHAEAIAMKLTDIDIATGVAINELFGTYVFKKAPNIAYFDPIHESLKHTNGTYLNTRYALDLNVNHSGYSPSLLPMKAKRNLEMLNAAAEHELAEYGAHRPLTDFYLMRENIFLENYDAAMESFMSLHRNPARIKEMLTHFALSSTYFFLAVRLVILRRNDISRRDIRENLVGLMKKLLPNYGGTDIIDVIYQANFDMKDDLFMETLDKIMAGFDAKSSRHDSESIRSFCYLCSRAAHIEWQRGGNAKAFDYCVARINNTDVFDRKTFSVLLSCIKGQPESEIIVFLNNLFDCRVPAKAHALAEGLQHNGFRVIFSYFVMQQIKAGVAAKKHFLQLLIANGNYEEAVTRALSIDEDTGDPNLIPDMIFFAVFCSDDMSLCEKYRDCLTDNGREIMDCYGAGGRIAKPELYIPSVLYSYYSNIAFLGGPEKAADFLNMFSGAPGICFMVEGKYFIENEMFSEVIHSPYLYGMEEGDPTSREIMMIALMRSGEFENALLRIKNMLNSYKIDQTLLNHLQSLTHCRNERVAAESKKLYEKQIYIYDEYVELDDIRRTGLVFNDFKKRDKQRFAALTVDELEAELAADDNIAGHITHHIALEQGAKIYESNDMDAMALHCFMRLRVCGYKSKQTTANIARLFGKLGNKGLSRRLQEIADAMPEAPDENPIDALPFYGAESANTGYTRIETVKPAVVRPIHAKPKAGSRKPH
ncbi:MAG: glycosyltransferase family 2 protein [Clostridiales Family XIII bacterium]|nr:glycosyltransferase family 2 protein [Clostridiales Family XIII bacterium]